NAYKSFSNYQLWAPFSVLWLLGAYLELVQLTSSRAQAVDQQDYYQRLQTLKLVGGGFPDFEQLSQHIYTLLDCVAWDNLTDRVQVGRQITQHLKQIPWMPQAFRDVLQGKNHLPPNKLHPRLLHPKRGFLGEGAYRAHFFGDKSLPFLAGFYLRERAKYASQSLQLKRKAKLRRRGLLSPPKWGRTAAVLVLIISSWFVGEGLKAGKMLESSANTAGQLDKAVMGLVNFLDNPTHFQFACGNQAGQVVSAAIDGDRLTIEVTYTTEASLWNATLIGSLDPQGVFNGAYQFRASNGLVSRDVRLSFEEDGSAQGVNKEWGNAIAILRI
ncbi:MAG: hypothetical protein QNJ46_13095, partial [Leptolyngbyaceae cyanobacterium MO_188.B28]|nr:hypothetical protein [Leptolyngbyaceae cyanobacterium MO_188.B28]